MKKASTLLNKVNKSRKNTAKAGYLTGSTPENCFKHEKSYIQQGYDFVIGVDEAGRGPLAGPVVAAAVALRNFEFRILNFETNSNFKNYNFKINSKFKIKNSKFLNLIRDSKLMTEKQREELYDFIIEHFYVGIGICDHRTIDRINILQATYLAMKVAVNNLKRNLYKCHSRGSLPTGQAGGNLVTGSRIKSGMTNFKHIILVDGNKAIPNISIEQEAIVNGDRLVKSISAASIIAKVTRDRIMREMDEKYPGYGFFQHKGYGTKMHREMIKKHGFCAIHRRSFKVK